LCWPALFPAGPKPSPWDIPLFKNLHGWEAGAEGKISLSTTRDPGGPNVWRKQPTTQMSDRTHLWEKHQKPSRTMSAHTLNGKTLRESKRWAILHWFKFSILGMDGTRPEVGSETLFRAWGSHADGTSVKTCTLNRVGLVPADCGVGCAPGQREENTPRSRTSLKKRSASTNRPKKEPG